MKPALSKEQIRELLVSYGFELKPQANGEEDLDSNVYEAVWAIISALATDGTPAAHRPQLSEDDEFRELLNKERRDLTMGQFTDDQVAHGIAVAGRQDLDLISWQFGAKDRIRWLSRHLSAALDREAALRKELGLDKDPNDTNNGQEIIDAE